MLHYWPHASSGFRAVPSGRGCPLQRRCVNPIRFCWVDYSMSSLCQSRNTLFLGDEHFFCTLISIFPLITGERCPQITCEWLPWDSDNKIHANYYKLLIWIFNSIIKNLSGQVFPLCIIHILDRIHLHSTHALRRLDICLCLSILPIFILEFLRYTHQQSVFCGTHHKSEYFPSKTIVQFDNKIDIWMRYTPSHVFCNLWLELDNKQGKSVLLDWIYPLWLIPSHLHNSSCLQSRVRYTGNTQNKHIWSMHTFLGF